MADLLKSRYEISLRETTATSANTAASTTATAHEFVVHSVVQLPTRHMLHTKLIPRHGRSRLVTPDSFNFEQHFYPKVLNAQIHPVVASFLTLTNDRIAARYCHMFPGVNSQKLKELLDYKPSFFFWAGNDLFHVTTVDGQKHMICVETNSCPSGQKSMPLLSENDSTGGYRTVIERSFLPLLQKADRSLGDIAVVYDKNEMETSGYAALIADLCKEPVHLIEFHESDPDPPVRWVDGVMHVRTETGEWQSIRAAFRYVTQRPWQRIPTKTKTVMLNSIVTCLAGGRNKSMAAKAYAQLNEDLQGTGLQIRTPQTKWDVSKQEAYDMVVQMGYHAVIKVPYANAGQGIFTITRAEELEEFMSIPFKYDRYILQSLVGNHGWSSETETGRYFHVGTIPDEKLRSYASDLRMMVCASPNQGFKPVAIYSRRAKEPLAQSLSETDASTWDILGTNLSEKMADGGWTTVTSRLLLMDRKDFNTLGLGIDDLIDGYIQTILCVVAIDKMSQRLMEGGEFNISRYKELSPDCALVNEIMQTS